VYPQHTWHVWKFKKAPQNIWQKHDNRVAFVEWAAKELNIQSMDDWYNISGAQVYGVGGSCPFSPRDVPFAQLSLIAVPCQVGD
jgi:hypothetical protein